MTQTAKKHKKYAAYKKSALEPKLPYRQAMQCYLITHEQRVQQINACTTEDFSQWLVAIIVSIPDGSYRYAVHDLLNGLDYRDCVDRWYALNLLTEKRIDLPLFQTFDQAQAVLSQGK